ncbi:MAG TPA: hypothetical protein VGF70_07060 [Solirubrobacteraceae bacterium]
MDRQDPPDRLRPAAEPRASAGSGADGADHDQPSFLSMVGLVALVVAVVILVFFGIGYLFGRVFL